MSNKITPSILEYLPKLEKNATWENAWDMVTELYPNIQAEFYLNVRPGEEGAELKLFNENKHIESFLFTLEEVFVDGNRDKEDVDFNVVMQPVVKYLIKNKMINKVLVAKKVTSKVTSKKKTTKK